MNQPQIKMQILLEKSPLWEDTMNKLIIDVDPILLIENMSETRESNFCFLLGVIGMY